MIILWPMDQPRLRLHTMRRAMKKSARTTYRWTALQDQACGRVLGCSDIISYYCLSQNTYVRTEITPASMIEHRAYPELEWALCTLPSWPAKKLRVNSCKERACTQKQHCFQNTYVPDSIKNPAFSFAPYIVDWWSLARRKKDPPTIASKHV